MNDPIVAIHMSDFRKILVQLKSKLAELNLSQDNIDDVMHMLQDSTCEYLVEHLK